MSTDTLFRRSYSREIMRAALLKINLRNRISDSFSEYICRTYNTTHLKREFFTYDIHE